VVLPDNVLFEDNVGAQIRADLMDKCDLHTILRLPTGHLLRPGREDQRALLHPRRRPTRATPQACGSTTCAPTCPAFGKRTPLTREHFAEFEKAYGDDPHGKSKRKDEGETGSFSGKFTREEIAERRGTARRQPRHLPGCSASDSDADKYRLHDGDFVFARSGSIEKAWRVRSPPPSVFASYLIRGQPVDGRISDWLEQFIRSPSYLAQIGAAGAGIGMQNVNATNLSAVSLPVPPLAEQKRIVAKIEDLTARSRRAKAALDAVPPLLDQLRQSILAAAFRGDLTADWRAKNPDVEPADKLLARIRTETPRPAGKPPSAAPAGKPPNSPWKISA
jgi:hypothetical protein